jgi:hypothetical protein
VNEYVVAVQPDEDGSEYVSHGWVESVNSEIGLIFIRVAWDGFIELEGPQGNVGNDTHWQASVMSP